MKYGDPVTFSPCGMLDCFSRCRLRYFNGVDGDMVTQSLYPAMILPFASAHSRIVCPRLGGSGAGRNRSKSLLIVILAATMVDFRPEV
jgi:hypothetical protein